MWLIPMSSKCVLVICWELIWVACFFSTCTSPWGWASSQHGGWIPRLSVVRDSSYGLKIWIRRDLDPFSWGEGCQKSAAIFNLPWTRLDCLPLSLWTVCFPAVWHFLRYLFTFIITPITHFVIVFFYFFMYFQWGQKLILEVGGKKILDLQ